MPNMRKFSSMKDIGHLDMHYKRGVKKGHYGNPDIDQEKLDEDKTNFAPKLYKKDKEGNYILDENKRKIEIKTTDYIKQTIDRIMKERTLRKDAVKMVTWVIDAPKNMPEELKPKFFEETYNFLLNRYGEKSKMGDEICLSCYWHKSEKTDHVHFAFMPIIDRNGEKSFCAKECVGREDLKTFHDDFENYMIKNGICKKGDIKNGNTIRDTTGRALSVKELKKQTYKRNHNEDLSNEHSKSRWDINTSRTIKNDRKEGRW